MYPMSMLPQYGGSRQPILHSSMYAPAQSISNADRQSLNQGRLLECHPNISSFYVNPQLADDDSILSRTYVTHHGNSSNAGHLSKHLNMSCSANSHEHAYDSHAASSKQRNYFSSSKQSSLNEELLLEMTQMHLGYIETEDSPHKMEQRQKLEDKIISFLSITPHQSKFAFRQVLEILENSVSMSNKFNAHKTACAFEALAQYASNLISQPWRKEYKQLKLYSGFWIHQISNYLIGAESILELMGYNSVYSKEQKNQFCSSTMPFMYVHNGILDPDLISRLALDCMIAYCECQCLHRIREGLSSFDFGFSQILEFRQRYIGDIECTTRHLLFNLKQNQQSELQRMKQLSCSPPPLPSRYSSHGTALPDRPPLKSPSASSANKHFAMPTNQDKHRVTDSSPDFIKSYKNHGSRGSSNHDTSYRTDNWDRGLPENNFASSVPTARLIDLDSDGSRARHLLPKVVNRKTKTFNQKYDEVDSRTAQSSCQQLSPEVLKPATLEEHMAASLNHISNAPTNVANSHQGKQLAESWGYVYKNLVEKGYSKDIGDRGDILNDFKHSGDCSKSYNYINNKKDKHKLQPISQAMQQVTLNEAKEKLDGKSQSSKNSLMDKNTASKRASLYDNLSTGFEQLADEEYKSSLQKINNNFRENKNDALDLKGQSEPREYISSERPKRTSQGEGPGSVGFGGKCTTWTCRMCTFINDGTRNICEICSKSKLFGSDEMHLESGSKECSNCTLINQRGDKKCSACKFPLDSCSTYI